MLLMFAGSIPWSLTAQGKPRILADYAHETPNQIIANTGKYDVFTGVFGGEWRFIFVPELNQIALVSQSPIFNGNWAHIWPKMLPIATVYARAPFRRYGSYWNSSVGFYLRWNLDTTSGILCMADAWNQRFRIITFSNGANVGESFINFDFRNPAVIATELVFDAQAVGNTVLARLLTPGGTLVLEHTANTTHLLPGRVGLLGVSEINASVAFRSLYIHDGVPLPQARDTLARTRGRRPVTLTPDASAFGPYALVPSSLDLDPATGNQGSVSTPEGLWVRQTNGSVIFTPAPGFRGLAQVPYTLEDSGGTAEWPALSNTGFLRVEVGRGRIAQESARRRLRR